jgi:hypothetical protein
MMENAHTLHVGDLVAATRPLAYGKIPAGTIGTVIEKFTPSTACMAWTVTVDFGRSDVEWCPIRFAYPGAPLVVVERSQ